MIKVLLSTDDQTLADRLTQAIGDAFRRVPAARAITDPAHFLSILGGASAPDILVLDADNDDASALRLAEALTRGHRINVLLVTSQADALGLPALRAGVRDVLLPEASPEELRAALDRTAELLTGPGYSTDSLPGEATPGGRVITVASPKGGVGKTTVATNLAVGLASRAPQATVLVDLDIHFGDVASALNLNPEFTLPDIARGPGSRDSIAVKSYLALHETGLFVIPGSDSPAAADSVTAEDVVRLLETLKAQFAFVVVDTAPGLSEHTLAVLDHTDTLVMVTSMDVPGVRGLRKELDTLSDLKMVMGMQQIVLNFADASRGLSVADVAATVRRNVDVVIPQSNAVPLSVNQGIPLLQSGGRDPVTRQLRSLLDTIAPETLPHTAQARSRFARRARA